MFDFPHVNSQNVLCPVFLHFCAYVKNRNILAIKFNFINQKSLRICTWWY